MSKSKLIKKEIIEETLNNKVTKGTKHLEPLKSLHFNKEIPFSIIVDSEGHDLGGYENYFTRTSTYDLITALPFFVTRHIFAA